MSCLRAEILGRAGDVIVFRGRESASVSSATRVCDAVLDREHDGSK